MDEIPPSILARIADEECVIYPTTTLPGLGCLPTTAALDRLFASKGRSADMPVSLAVASIEQAEAIVEIPLLARQLIATAPQQASQSSCVHTTRWMTELEVKMSQFEY